MPAKSQAQHRLMCAAAKGKVEGVPKKVGQEYCKKTHDVKSLPERKNGKK